MLADRRRAGGYPLWRLPGFDVQQPILHREVNTARDASIIRVQHHRLIGPVGLPQYLRDAPTLGIHDAPLEIVEVHP